MLTKDQKIAFAEFLLSEKDRHEADITMIEEKLRLLASQGIVPSRIAPWVTDEMIQSDDDEQWNRPSITEAPEAPERSIDIFVDTNKSPFGGYWRYQVDKMFENATGEDNDGFPTDD